MRGIPSWIIVVNGRISTYSIQFGPYFYRDVHTLSSPFQICDNQIPCLWVLNKNMTGVKIRRGWVTGINILLCLMTYSWMILIRHWPDQLYFSDALCKLLGYNLSDNISLYVGIVLFRHARRPLIGQVANLMKSDISTTQ